MNGVGGRVEEEAVNQRKEEGEKGTWEGVGEGGVGSRMVGGSESIHHRNQEQWAKCKLFFFFLVFHSRKREGEGGARINFPLSACSAEKLPCFSPNQTCPRAFSCLLYFPKRRGRRQIFHKRCLFLSFFFILFTLFSFFFIECARLLLYRRVPTLAFLITFLSHLGEK